MNVRCPLSILIECSKCLLAAASSSNWDDRSLFRNDRIALSVNSRGKSSRVPYRYSIAKQSSAQRCWSVMACWASHAVSHPKQSNGFRSGDLNISEVIFKRRRRRTACIGSAAAVARAVFELYGSQSMPGPLTCYDGPLTIRKIPDTEGAAVGPPSAPHFCVNEMIMISFNPYHNIHR